MKAVTVLGCGCGHLLIVDCTGCDEVLVQVYQHCVILVYRGKIWLRTGEEEVSLRI